jgi:hypothetical protein
MTVTLLESSFEPSELSPGYYTAYSDTEAYPVLYGMTLTKQAEDAGRHYWKGGVVQILAAVGLPKVEENAGERTFREGVVKIPHSYFTGVTEDYGDWREMWWRETIQNAVDAEASKIECNVKQQDDGTWLVSCRDNGHGMDLETIENVFFTLRESHKLGAARHGGFGEAKKLIALAWIKFRVLSGDVEVVGSGAEWPKLGVYEGGESIQGTLIEVVMPADKHTSEAAAISYIKKCNLPDVQFLVNDVPYEANLESGEFKRDLPLNSKLFYNRHIHDLHAVMIRSNGLYMFDYKLPTDFRGVIFVEVYPQKDFPRPQDIFVSNRMAFKYRYEQDLRSAVEQVVSKASADVKQALRAPDALVRKRYEGFGFFSTGEADKREAVVREIVGILPEAGPGKSLAMGGDIVKPVISFLEKMRSLDLEEAEGDESKLLTTLEPAAAEIILKTPVKGESHLEAAIAQLVWKPNFININDETLREDFRLDPKFEPATMTPTIYALARLWASYVKFILIKMGSSITWGTGFCFSKEAQGMYYRDSSERWILLNPYNLETGQILSIRNEADVRQIFETAMHEASHIIDGSDYHGEGFTRILDGVVVEMLKHWNDAKRMAKKTKIRGVLKAPKALKAATESAVSQEDNCSVKTFTDSPKSLILRPIGETLEEFSSNLYYPPEQVLAFLYKNRVDAFLKTLPSYVTTMVADAKQVACFVSKEELEGIFKEAFDPKTDFHPEDPMFMMPLRIWIRSDGKVAFVPADIRYRRYFSRPWDMTLAGSILVTDYKPRDFVSSLFTYNPFIKNGKQLADKFMAGQEVIIPVDTIFYETNINNIYGIEDKVYYNYSDVINVDLEWDDETLLLSSHFSGSQKYYMNQYDLPNQDFIIRISDNNEQEFIIANSNISSYQNKKLLEDREQISFDMNRPFFEQVLEYHLKELQSEKLRSEEGNEMDMTQTTGVGVFSYGKDAPEVLQVYLIDSEAAYREKYGIPPERRVAFFAYGKDKDDILEEVSNADVELIESALSSGDPVVVDMPVYMINAFMDVTFGDVVPVDIHKAGVIPVSLTYEEDAEALYIAPMDSRQVAFLRKGGLKTTEMVAKVADTDEIREIIDEIFSTTYTEEGASNKKTDYLINGEVVLGLIAPAYYMDLLERYS